MTFAVIQTGGKQYTVAPKDEITIEKLEGKEGDTINFTEVFLVGDEKGKEVSVGTPTVKSVKVTGTILSQEKAKKVTVIKYKAKVRYMRTKGHRQQVTRVRIDKIA